MFLYINNTLSSLLRRPPGAPLLQQFTVAIWLNPESLGEDGIWIVSVEGSRAMEDILLQLIASGAISTVQAYVGTPHRDEGSEEVAYISQLKDIFRATITITSQICERELEKYFPRLYENDLIIAIPEPVLIGGRGYSSHVLYAEHVLSPSSLTGTWRTTQTRRIADLYVILRPNNIPLGNCPCTGSIVLE